MNEKKSVNKLVTLVFKAIGLAMAVAAIVLNVLGTVSIETLIVFLSIGLFSLAISSFSNE
jgi:energy-converting hydrogenase Eha subunit A